MPSDQADEFAKIHISINHQTTGNLSMKCYGILPMAGKGSRLQPIAFSKELYPVAYKNRHYAISEFSIRALQHAKVDEIKLVIHPEKIDIVKKYATYNANISMVFYNSPSLPESCLYPISNLNDNDICLFGLPDTIFSPLASFVRLKRQLLHGADICLGVFKVPDGSRYDSVRIDQAGRVRGVLVKKSPPLSNWIWGIWGANVATLKKLKKHIMSQKTRGDRLLGVGFNVLAKEGKVNFKAVKLSSNYFDVGTMDAVIKVNSVINNFKL